MRRGCLWHRTRRTTFTEHPRRGYANINKECGVRNLASIVFLCEHTFTGTDIACVSADMGRAVTDEDCHVVHVAPVSCDEELVGFSPVATASLMVFLIRICMAFQTSC